MAKKRVPQSDPNTEIGQKAVTPNKKEKVRFLEEYFNFTTQERELLTTGTAERIARELVAEVRSDEDMLKISQFLEKRGINRKTWSRWCANYQVIADAHDFALMVIGNRREVGVMTRKFDSASTSFMMTMYDVDWRENVALRAKLNSPEGLSSGQKFVVIERYPDSPLVPERKVDE